MRGPIVALLIAFALASTTSARSPIQSRLSAAAVDARVHLPGGLKATQYARYYLLKTIRGEQDLPFSTSFSFKLREPLEVWLALFIKTPSVFSSDPPGLQVVEDPRKFPEVVHGGCVAVNVVADARTGATLGSWCNVSGVPGPSPGYLPSGSPLMPSDPQSERRKP